MSHTTVKSLFAALLVPAAALAAPAPTVSPIYINSSPLTAPPQVDATIFWNRSTMNIFTVFPYQAQDVQFWTNNGVMAGSPGFLFEYDIDTKTARKLRPRSRSLQRPSVSFHNDGIISGDPILSINAKNLFNSGRLDSGEFGVISVLATNGIANLSRSTIRSGPPTGVFIPCEFPSTQTNFFTDPHITGLYWGNGRNNALGTNGQPLDLRTAGFLFDPARTFFSSPSHEVRIPGSTFTNVVSVPSFFGCGSGYQSFVFTNGFGTNMTVSIAIVPTNSLIQTSNLDVGVRFTPVVGSPGTELEFAL